MNGTFKPQKSIHPRQYKYHIVLSFEDNGMTFYVVKYFGIHKQWWHYEIWESWEMEDNKAIGWKIVGLKRNKEDKQ